MCQCPAAGVTAGTGCTTLGATVCQGNIVLTCINDPASGCHYWAKPNDCSAGSLVCGTKSGAAACQCADHTGTDYFVDPVNGSDVAAGFFPTGVDTPSFCRFATLGKGLSLAVSGDRVVATSPTPPVTFSAETFPMGVPAGVTLTTSDLTPTPVNYGIVFNSAGATDGVVLASNSTIEGFSIVNSGGNASAVALLAVGTGVTINTVFLDGTGGGTTNQFGIGLGGASQAAINGVTVTGYLFGVAEQTTGAGSTITNSTIQANGTGIGIANGSLTATSVTVNGGTGNGILMAPAAGETTTFLGSALTVTDMSGAGISQQSTGGSATFSITGGEITANAGGGVKLTAGVGTLSAVNVHANTGNGATVTGTATLTSNTGTQYVSNTGNGISSTGATLIFNGSAASPITVSGNTLDGILAAGGVLTANYLTVSANGTGATKSSGLELSGVVGVTMGLAGDSAISITGNGLHGVNINGPIVGTSIDLESSTISNNGSKGVSADLNWGTGDANTKALFKSLTISGNGANGIEILRAPLIAATIGCTLDTLTVTGNGGGGVVLSGGSGDVGATVKNSKISSNTGTGLLVEEAAGTTTETIQSNDVFSNGGSGIAFVTKSTLNGFTGNMIHSNTADQIVVSATQNTTPVWRFDSPTGCDGNRNQVYCYTAPSVGLRINSATATGVVARLISWANPLPTAATDYVLVPPNAILTAPSCAPVLTCP
jgi:hypothetical protein